VSAVESDRQDDGGQQGRAGDDGAEAERAATGGVEVLAEKTGYQGDRCAEERQQEQGDEDGVHREASVGAQAEG
jgi:hypothetical protein